jgi:hypothetical protein
MAGSGNGELRDVGCSDLGFQDRRFFSNISDFARGDFVLRYSAGLSGTRGNQPLRTILKLTCTPCGNHYVAKIAIELLLNTHGLLLKKNIVALA